MKLHKNELCLCLLSFLVCFISCDSDNFRGCEKDYVFYTDNFLHFKVFDKKTGVNLLQVGVNEFHRDTVQIYDENLRPTGTRPDFDGSISFAFLELTRDYNEPLDELIEHRYFLYFGKNDYDTINISYRVGIDRCKQRILKQWAVSYNDSTYFDRPHNPYRFSGSVIFLKQVF